MATAVDSQSCCQMQSFLSQWDVKDIGEAGKLEVANEHGRHLPPETWEPLQDHVLQDRVLSRVCIYDDL